MADEREQLLIQLEELGFQLDEGMRRRASNMALKGWRDKHLLLIKCVEIAGPEYEQDMRDKSKRELEEYLENAGVSTSVEEDEVIEPAVTSGTNRSRDHRNDNDNDGDDRATSYDGIHDDLTSDDKHTRARAQPIHTRNRRSAQDDWEEEDKMGAHHNGESNDADQEVAVDQDYEVDSRRRSKVIGARESDRRSKQQPLHSSSSNEEDETNYGTEEVNGYASPPTLASRHAPTAAIKPRVVATPSQQQQTPRIQGRVPVASSRAPPLDDMAPAPANESNPSSLLAPGGSSARMQQPPGIRVHEHLISSFDQPSIDLMEQPILKETLRAFDSVNKAFQQLQHIQSNLLYPVLVSHCLDEEEREWFQKTRTSSGDAFGPPSVIPQQASQTPVAPATQNPVFVLYQAQKRFVILLVQLLATRKNLHNLQLTREQQERLQAKQQALENLTRLQDSKFQYLVTHLNRLASNRQHPHHGLFAQARTLIDSLPPDHVMPVTQQAQLGPVDGSGRIGGGTATSMIPPTTPAAAVVTATAPNASAFAKPFMQTQQNPSLPLTSNPYMFGPMMHTPSIQQQQQQYAMFAQQQQQHLQHHQPYGSFY